MTSKSIPVRLSSGFMAEADEGARLMSRSLPGQIEYWGKIGRAIELIGCSHSDIQVLLACGATRVVHSPAIEAALTRIRDKIAQSFMLNEQSSATREHLMRKEGLIYEDAKQPGLFIRELPNGTKVRGRIEGRKFVPDDSLRKRM